MNRYLEDALHYANLAYYTNDWIINNLDKSDELNYYEIKSLNFIKSNNLNVNISNKIDLGLPNILHSKKDNKLFISFPGIRTNDDKLNCLNFKLKYIEDIKSNIHKGFSDIFYKLKDEVDLIININLNEINEIIFCGHSLGGAIAKLFSLYCKLTYSLKVYCYTFACPIIGDDTFSNMLNNNLNNLFTLCCEKDFLIRIPSWRTCNENKKYMINNNNLETYKNLTNDYLYNFLILEANTHRLYHYIDFIENKSFNLNI
jgi:hypothetical protein